MTAYLAHYLIYVALFIFTLHGLNTESTVGITFLFILLTIFHWKIMSAVGDIIKKNLFYYDSSVIQRRVVLVMMWTIAVFVAGRVGWLSENLDPALILFLAYSPCIWLLGCNQLVNSSMAAISIVMTTAILLAGGIESAQRFAVLTILFLGTSTILGVYNLYFAKS